MLHGDRCAACGSTRDLHDATPPHMCPREECEGFRKSAYRDALSWAVWPKGKPDAYRLVQAETEAFAARLFLDAYLPVGEHEVVVSRPYLPSDVPRLFAVKKSLDVSEAKRGES